MTAPYFGVKTVTYSTFQRYPQVAPYSGLFFCKISVFGMIFALKHMFSPYSICFFKKVYISLDKLYI